MLANARRTMLIVVTSAAKIEYITFSFPNPAHSGWENYRKPGERLGNIPENSPANCDWNTGILLYFMMYVKYLQKYERYGNINAM